MPQRLKLFLTFAILCVTPLLVLSWLNFRVGLHSTEVILRARLADELREVARHYDTLVRERGRELTAIATGPLPSYLRNARNADEIALINSPGESQSPGTAAACAYFARVAIISLPPYYASLACFDAGKRELFLFQPKGQETPVFRTKDFLPGEIEPDEGVWSRRPDSPPQCSIVSSPRFVDLRRCSVVIAPMPDQSTTATRGVLVADMRLDELFAEIDQGQAPDAAANPLERHVIVLDSAGTVVHYLNNNLGKRPVSSAIPEFVPVATAMLASRDTGMGEYRSAAGETWLVAYRPIDVPGLWLAVARNYSQATQAQYRFVWLTTTLSLLFGFAGAILLTAYTQKRTQRIGRVVEKATAIAGGDFAQRVEARSSDDLRPLADSLNAISDQLREKIAKEAEDHQFQSFMKLSALLTHDLKNAIETLSLMVSNLERHFDKPEFRADALKGLASATDKLRALVARLSKPVSTLSGEFKPPRPTDLIPLINRVLKQIGDPLSDRHEFVVRVPPTLFALADAERIEKVIENLILNAVEAMSEKPGQVTVTAGAAAAGKVFFSVTDTGVGMSTEFIQRKLFRPFATTKGTGVGLGLYTCREVVRANGGVIEVDSVPGSGTTFRVVLASAKPKGSLTSKLSGSDRQTQ